MRSTFRGFSLLEVMLVVALLGILAAIAIPAFTPQLRQTQLDNAGEAVASFIAQARIEAMGSKRCVRVWIDSTDPRVLNAERLNNFDCDTTPNTLPNAAAGLNPDGNANIWNPLVSGRLQLEQPQLTVSLSTAPAKVPASSAQCAGILNGASTLPNYPGCSAQIAFRPNGRVWQQDGFVSGAAPVDNDDGVLRVSHTRDPSLFVAVLVNSNGLICTLPRNTNPPPDANGDFKCP